MTRAATAPVAAWRSALSPRSVRSWNGLAVLLGLLLFGGVPIAPLLPGPAAAQAQNLVPNPSFEIYSQCPDFPDQINRATPWTMPTLGTSDDYNACAGNDPNVSVPANQFGNQAARTGNGYAGFILRSSTGGSYREYIEVPLTAPLAAGVAYDVSFYVSLSDQSRWAIDQLGAYLSVGQVGPVNTASVLGVAPQVINPTGNNITNKTGWTLVSGTYVALGGEDHLVIGNFANDASTTPVTGLGGFYDGSYYYIDDVAVVRAETVCVTPPSVMVAWWPLDETTGTHVQDIWGGHDGGVIGASINTGGILNPFPPVMVNGHLYFFDPAANYVSVPPNPVFDFGTSGSFSIDAWINKVGGNSSSDYAPIVDTRSNPISGPPSGYLFAVDGAYHLRFLLGGTGYQSIGTLSPQVWHHVAVTVDRSTSPAGTVTLYIDGNPDGPPIMNLSSAESATSGLPLLLGGTYLDSSLLSTEYALDEIEIFSRALMPTEIGDIHNAGSAGKCKPIPCVGDCDGDGTVTVNELILMVNIALGNLPVSACTAGDANGDGSITIDEILIAVNNALSGCPCRFIGPRMCGGTCPRATDVCQPLPDDSGCVCQPRVVLTSTPTPPPTPTASFTGRPTATRTPTASVTRTPSATVTPTATPTGTQCVPAPPNMIAWWQLNEASGVTVADIGGSPAHNGTAQPAPIGSGGPFSVAGNLTTNPADTALEFPVPTAYVEVPASSDLELAHSSFTIDAWIQPIEVHPVLPGTIHVVEPIVDKLGSATTGNGNTGYALYLEITATCALCPPTGPLPPGTMQTVDMRLVLAIGDGLTTFFYPSSSIYPGGSGGVWTPAGSIVPAWPGWMHIAVAVDRTAGNTGTFYLNGGIAGGFTPIVGTDSGSATEFLIGGTRVYPFIIPIHGEIEINELEVFTVPLSPAEVQSIAASPGGKCQGVPPTATSTATPTVTHTPTPTCVPNEFKDTTFADADWTLTAFTAGTGGTTTGVHSPSNGCPAGGDDRDVGITVNPSLGFPVPGIVWGVHIKASALYNPSISGPIPSLNYSEMTNNLGALNGAGQGTGPALQQGSSFYIPNPLMPTGIFPTCQPLSYPPLTATNFCLLSGAAGQATVDCTQHPDFSCNGRPISFGFVRANSTMPDSTGYSTLHTMDDWDIQLTCGPPCSTPTPSPTATRTPTSTPTITSTSTPSGCSYCSFDTVCSGVPCNTTSDCDGLGPSPLCDPACAPLGISRFISTGPPGNPGGWQVTAPNSTVPGGLGPHLVQALLPVAVWADLQPAAQWVGPDQACGCLISPCTLSSQFGDCPVGVYTYELCWNQCGPLISDTHCTGGANDGVLCSTPIDCPGGTCGWLSVAADNTAAVSLTHNGLPVAGGGAVSGFSTPTSIPFTDPGPGSNCLHVAVSNSAVSPTGMVLRGTITGEVAVCGGPGVPCTPPSGLTSDCCSGICTSGSTCQ